MWYTILWARKFPGQRRRGYIICLYIYIYYIVRWLFSAGNKTELKLIYRPPSLHRGYRIDAFF